MQVASNREGKDRCIQQTFNYWLLCQMPLIFAQNFMRMQSMQYACVQIFKHSRIGIRQEEAASILHFGSRLIFGRICIFAVSGGGRVVGMETIRCRSPTAKFSQILLFWKANVIPCVLYLSVDRALVQPELWDRFCYFTTDKNLMFLYSFGKA